MSWRCSSASRACRCAVSGRRKPASGRPTAPISRARATRRSIKSTRATSASCSSRSASRPRTSGPRPEFQFQGTPLMVNGRLFTTAGTRRAVVALDATDRRDAVDAQPQRGQARRSGAAPVVGPRPRLLERRQERTACIYVTPGYQMFALDADDRRSRRRLRHRRHRRSETEQRSGDRSRSPARSACTPRRSSRGHDRDRRGASRRRRAAQQEQRQKGYIRGFDVRTGKRLWIFHTIPMKGEFGYDTWDPDANAVHRQRRRVGADEHRRGAGPRLHAGGAADRRLLRRPSARQSGKGTGREPVFGEPGRRRYQDRRSANGITSSCTTASGITTFRARRS